MINEKEKRLYNTYLMISRTSRNKPFKPRKNFENFEDNSDYVFVKKIARFLGQYPQIKTDSYFKAPFVLYEDVEHIPLKYFATQKAIKSYTTYMNQLQEESPDSQHHIEFIKTSLRFIGMFCIKNKIPLEKYMSHCTGITYDWMKHVKERNVSIFSLFEFSNVFDTITESPDDEVYMLLGEVGDKIYVYKNKYDKSVNAKRIVKEGLKRVKKVVDKSV